MALSEGFECKCIHANPIRDLFVIFQKTAKPVKYFRDQITQNSAHRLVILGMTNDKMAIMQIRAYLAYCMQHHNCRVQLLQLMCKKRKKKNIYIYSFVGNMQPMKAVFSSISKTKLIKEWCEFL